MTSRRLRLRKPDAPEEAREHRRNAGKMLFRTRIAAGMTQLEVAKRIGVHQVRISQFEIGLSSVPSDLLRPMATAMGCRPHHFSREYLVVADPDLHDALFRVEEA
jgi:transcriptional regulator with XRE-family HTH domain